MFDDKQRGEQGAVHGECFTYVILSTNRQAAEDSPMTGFGTGRPLANRHDFWPSDPCASVKRACA